MITEQFLAEFLEWCILENKDIYDAEARFEVSKFYLKNKNKEVR